MRAVVVEVGLPCRYQIAGMAQGVEQVFVQAFISHATVEAFHEAILQRCSLRDVMPVNLAVLLPLPDRVAGQFGPMVTDHHAGIWHFKNAGCRFQKAPLIGCCYARAANPNAIF